MFNTFFYQPLYNGLVWFTSITPGHRLAIAIILLTLVVKIILLPLSKKAVVTQMKMKLVEPEMKKIRDTYNKPEDRQILAQKTLELYRKYELNPFSTIFLVFLQIPIFIALALMFGRNALAVIDTSLLYSFVHAPEIINQMFFGLDLSQKSAILGAIAGILQFFQIRNSLPAHKKLEEGVTPTFKDDLARSMNMQMRYVLPVIVFVASLRFTAALSIYWIVSTAFTIGQELYFRRTVKKDTHV